MACRVSLAAVVVAVFLSSTVHAQVFFPGNCPKTPVIMDFRFGKYLGRWVEQERYFVAYQKKGWCWDQTYRRNGQTGKTYVTVTYRDVFDKPQFITMEVAQKGSNEPNRFTYTVFGKAGSGEHHYEVLDTDYNNWALEYTCSNEPPFGHTRIVWLLTRHPLPEECIISVAKERLTKLGMDASLLTKQNTSCFE